MTPKLRSMASIYLLHGDRILLLHRAGGAVADGTYVGAAGGHFEENELTNATACVLREMQEEISLTSDDITDLSLRYITLRHSGSEIRQNYYFFARLKNPDRPLDSNEGTLVWCSSKDLAALPMPFTAKYVLRHYLKLGRTNNALYGGVADGERVIFSEMPRN